MLSEKIRTDERILQKHGQCKDRRKTVCTTPRCRCSDPWWVMEQTSRVVSQSAEWNYKF